MFSMHGVERFETLRSKAGFSASMLGGPLGHWPVGTEASQQHREIALDICLWPRSAYYKHSTRTDPSSNLTLLPKQQNTIGARTFAPEKKVGELGPIPDSTTMTSSPCHWASSEVRFAT